MTATIDPELVARLRARYAPEEPQPCVVCGGELSIQSMGGGRATEWAHSSPDGVSMRDWSSHYSASSWTQFRRGDREVLALLDALDAREVRWGIEERETLDGPWTSVDDGTGWSGRRGRGYTEAEAREITQRTVRGVETSAWRRVVFQSVGAWMPAPPVS